MSARLLQSDLFDDVDLQTLLAQDGHPGTPPMSPHSPQDWLQPSALGLSPQHIGTAFTYSPTIPRAGQPAGSPGSRQVSAVQTSAAPAALPHGVDFHAGIYKQEAQAPLPPPQSLGIPASNAHRPHAHQAAMPMHFAYGSATGPAPLSHSLSGSVPPLHHSLSASSLPRHGGLQQPPIRTGSWCGGSVMFHTCFLVLKDGTPFIRLLSSCTREASTVPCHAHDVCLAYNAPQESAGGAGHGRRVTSTFRRVRGRRRRWGRHADRSNRGCRRHSPRPGKEPGCTEEVQVRTACSSVQLLLPFPCSEHTNSSFFRRRLAALRLQHVELPLVVGIRRQGMAPATT